MDEDGKRLREEEEWGKEVDEENENKIYKRKRTDGRNRTINKEQRKRK